MSSPAVPSAPAAPLDALSGLRFLAALHVVVFHLWRPVWSSAPAWVQTVCGHGYVAVGLFFVLSGFVLTAVYVGGDRLGPGSRRAYFMARFARVYPLYLLALLGYLAFWAWQGTLAPGVLAGQLLLLQAWCVGAPALTAGNYPAWSLTVEAAFYALFPLLPFAWLARRGTGALVAFGAASWALGLAAVAALLALAPAGELPHHGFWYDVVRFFPPLHLPAFLAGVLGGVWWTRRPADAPAGPWRYVPEIALLAGYGAIVVARKVLPDPTIFIHTGLLVPVFVALVLGLACGDGPLRRLLASRAFVALGLASYATYLLHVPLWDLVGGHAFVAAAAARPQDLVVGLAGFTACLIGLSLAAHRWVEQPARTWLQGLVRRPAVPAAAVPERPAA